MAQSQERYTGTITRWMLERGFGFAKVDGIDEDVFMWGEEMPVDPTAIKKGDRFSFTLVPGKPGMSRKAKHVLPAEDPIDYADAPADEAEDDALAF